MNQKADLIDQRQEKLDEIRSRGYDPYPHKYSLTQRIAQAREAFSSSSAEELESSKPELQTAGRLISVRGHGKASFAHLAEGGDRLQIYVRQDRVGQEQYELFRLLDVGDIIGVQGVLFRTRTDELTIMADQLTLLSKSMLSLPEKWHGLADVETRYRQRYLDLLVNPRVRQIFTRRSAIISCLRRFLEERAYIEVETPMMQTLAGGAAARPFETFHEALGIPLYLRIAPELFLKRLVVGGMDRVFEINRNFRNEGVSTRHNPEFTMLEFYQAYSDYRDLMDLTEEMLAWVVQEVTGSLQVDFGGSTIDFSSFHRYSMVEAVQKFWQGEDSPSSDQLCDLDGVAESLRGLGVSVPPGAGWGKLLGLLFDSVVEEQLVQPTFIYDFPAELSPLSKTKDEDPRFAERFEIFVGGLEIGNAYSELNDPAEQKQRFEEQLGAREQGDEEAHLMDHDYIQALHYGMPPTAGEGIGIDRLVMLLTDSSSIREVILFPHLKPRGV